MFWGRQRSTSSPSRLCCASFSVSVLNFATSPNSGVKFFWGFLSSGKSILRFIFSGYVFFLVFFSSAAIARRLIFLSTRRSFFVRFPGPAGGAAFQVGVCCSCRGPPLLFIFRFGLRGVCVALDQVVSCLRGVRRCPSRSWVSWSPSRLPHSFGLRLCLPATALVGCLSACPGCLFLRWAAALGWVSPVLAGRSSGILSGGPVGAAFGTVWLEGLPASRGVGARLRGCVSVSCPPPPLFFFSVLFVCFPPFFFLGGGVCLFLPLPSLGWCTHWSAFGVVKRVAVGACDLLSRAPDPWVSWVMYKLGPVAFPVWLRSGSASWAVVPGGFVRPWLRGGGVFRVPPPLWCRL